MRDAIRAAEHWRQELGARRNALSREERARCDQLILDRLYHLPEWKKFAKIGSFVALGAEPDLAAITGKRIYLPRFDSNTGAYVMAEIRDKNQDLVRGRYGIPEPRPELPAATAQELDEMLFLVPAVGCDRRGVRLGRRVIGPQDGLKKDSRGLSRVAAGNPRFPRLLQGTIGNLPGCL